MDNTPTGAIIMKPVYQSHQIKQVDKLSAEHLQINSFQLMKKAGRSIFEYIKNYKKICIVAGAGNNAGDGFIIAKLALDLNKDVYVWSLINPEKFCGDAKYAVQEYLSAGGKISAAPPVNNYECIVDALFGTGLCRDIEEKFADAVEWINLQSGNVVSVDIPSGLDADTGCVRGVAVKANTTVSVISYKPGLITNNGKDYCGKLFLEDLDVPQGVFAIEKPNISLLNISLLSKLYQQRKQNSHKGSFGRAVIVGGNDGMLGASILSGRAALRSGCGLVETVNNNEYPELVSLHCPELITAGSIYSSRLIQNCDVVAVGPGLGLNSESQDTLNFCLKQQKPMVIDADALTLVARQNECFSHPVIMTPHPKEAADLLGTTIKQVQSDRVLAAENISRKYNCITVLKGSGTIICDTNRHKYICPYGYDGMATAGMGDVLTGMIAGLLAQGYSEIDSATTAVVWHAVTAENCEKGNSLIASDVIENLHKRAWHNS